MPRDVLQNPIAFTRAKTAGNASFHPTGAEIYELGKEIQYLIALPDTAIHNETLSARGIEFGIRPEVKNLIDAGEIEFSPVLGKTNFGKTVWPTGEQVHPGPRRSRYAVFGDRNAVFGERRFRRYGDLMNRQTREEFVEQFPWITPPPGMFGGGDDDSGECAEDTMAMAGMPCDTVCVSHPTYGDGELTWTPGAGDYSGQWTGTVGEEDHIASIVPTDAGGGDAQYTLYDDGFEEGNQVAADDPLCPPIGDYGAGWAVVPCDVTSGSSSSASSSYPTSSSYPSSSSSSSSSYYSKMAIVYIGAHGARGGHEQVQNQRKVAREPSSPARGRAERPPQRQTDFPKNWLAWHCTEAPEVWFEDRLSGVIESRNGRAVLPVPAEFTGSIEPGTLVPVNALCEMDGDLGAAAVADGSGIEVFGPASWIRKRPRRVSVTIRGIRKGYAEVSYARKTAAEAARNAAFYGQGRIQGGGLEEGFRFRGSGISEGETPVIVI